MVEEKIVFGNKIDFGIIVKVFVFFLNDSLQEKRRNLLNIGFEPPFVFIVEVYTQYSTFVI
jgi:hypothetical protein